MIVLFVLCLFVILVVSHFGFKCGTLVLAASVPGHCLPFVSKTNFCHYATLWNNFLYGF